MQTNQTILIIDDDEDFHILVGRMLRQSGFKTKSFYSAPEKDVSGFDLILLDIELPTISGVDIGKEFKSRQVTSNIPIIMISGHLEGAKLAEECQADVFIQKPLLLSFLLKKVKEMLSR